MRCLCDVYVMLFLNNTWHDDQDRMHRVCWSAGGSTTIIIIIIVIIHHRKLRVTNKVVGTETVGVTTTVGHTTLVRTGDSAYPTRRRTANMWAARHLFAPSVTRTACSRRQFSSSVFQVWATEYESIAEAEEIVRYIQLWSL